MDKRTIRPPTKDKQLEEITTKSFGRNDAQNTNGQQNITISEEERKEGGDELTGVNWGPVDPATHQATKIACGVRTWIEDVQFFQK